MKKKIHPEQQAFMNAIKANPKDQETHLVYADWLDEHDQPELADLERKWTVAKYEEAWQFMEECFEQCRGYKSEVESEESDEYDQYHSPIKTIEALIEAATNYLNTGEGVHFGFMSPELKKIDSGNLM